MESSGSVLFCNISYSFIYSSASHICSICSCGIAPAGALEVEGGVEKWYAIVDYLQNYQREENMTDPDDAINSALEEFWEVQDGSDGSTEQEELL